MNKWRVLILAENLWLNLDEGPRRMGFYQTMYLEAVDTNNAQSEALTIVRDANPHDSLSNSREDPPIFKVDEIEELASFDGIDSRIQGRAFFPMDDNEH